MQMIIKKIQVYGTNELKMSPIRAGEQFFIVIGGKGLESQSFTAVKDVAKDDMGKVSFKRDLKG